MNTVDALDNIEDGMLIRSWQRGNERSFSRLFHRYFQTNYRYINSIIRDRLIAEEIAMDVMFSVWRRKEYIDAGMPVLPFMLKISRNRVIDHIRRKKPKTEPAREMADILSASCVYSSDFPLLAKEADKIYERVLAGLASKRKLAFRLSREWGMSYAEIAKQMNLSRNTVENHIGRALKDIKIHLRRASFGDYP